MPTIKDLSKGKRELYKFLGKEPYEIKCIDLEECIYLKIGSYDIEISGGIHIRDNFNIFVWDIGKGYTIVERYMDVKPNYPNVEKLLKFIRLRYGDKRLLNELAQN